MRLYEIERIKLGKGKSDKTNLFLADLENITSEHPFDSRSRILNNATIEVSTFAGDIHISDIRSLAPNSGAGTEAIKILMQLADKYHIRLHLIAKAYSKDPKYITDTNKLIKWYQKLGFVVDDEFLDDRAVELNDYEGYDEVEMVYYPK